MSYVKQDHKHDCTHKNMLAIWNRYVCYINEDNKHDYTFKNAGYMKYVYLLSKARSYSWLYTYKHAS